ncbi:MAG: AtpZ/AtpI family protein [Desulfovibrionaceae bacterium]|nr:AtpZ/AtpI family protein [Desulfovibrionaceae bacterium]
MLFSKDGRWVQITQLGGTAGTMGLHIVSAIIVGLAIGYFLDGYFGTKPWFIMIFFFVGVVAGFKMVYEDFRKLQRREEARKAGSLKQDGEESAGQDEPRA